MGQVHNKTHRPFIEKMSRMSVQIRQFTPDKTAVARNERQFAIAAENNPGRVGDIEATTQPWRKR